MKRMLWLVILVSVGSNLSFGQASSPQPSSDESAIRSAAETYQTAFNEREAVALAKHFTEGAELATGETILRGRKAIEDDFVSLFAGEDIPKLLLTEITVDVISPNVAIETGTAVLTLDERTEAVPYRAVHVKTLNGWLLDRVQDEPMVELPPSNYQHLQVLEWLVGKWTIEAGDATTTLSCRWTSNQNFLVQSYSVRSAAGVELEGTQVIGWDPSRMRIRSWLFDSDGGFGSGAWSGELDTWTAQTLQIVPSGEEATSSNIYKRIDENTMEFSSIGRQVGGRLLKNIAPVRFKRN